MITFSMILSNKLRKFLVIFTLICVGTVFVAIKKPFYHYDEYTIEQCHISGVNIKYCKCMIIASDKYLGTELSRRYIEASVGESPESIKESVLKFYGSLTEEENERRFQYYQELEKKCLKFDKPKDN